MPPRPRRGGKTRRVRRGPAYIPPARQFPSSQPAGRPAAAFDAEAAFGPDPGVTPEATGAIAAPPAGRLRVIRAAQRASRPGVVIKRDYGYVRGELLRIVMLGGGIFIAIGVIALVSR